MKLKAPAGLIKKSDSLWVQWARKLAALLVSLQAFYVLQFLICSLILTAHVSLLSSGVLNRMEWMVLDLFFKTRPAVQTHDAISVIEIAEDSIQQIGRWPWPRQYHAVLTHVLHQAGAKAVAFDMFFSEPSTELDDGALQESLTESSSVYLPVILEPRGSEKIWIHSMPALEASMKGSGHINIFPDSDGTLRRIQPFLETSGQTHPHMAVQIAYDYLGKPVPPKDQLPFPLDEDGAMLINWAGGWDKTFHHYSYVDILKSFEAVEKGEKPRLDFSLLKDKIFFVGLTATGHADIKATPMASSYPAMGVLANTVNSILTQQYLRPASERMNQVCLAAFGLMIAVFCIPFRNIFSLFLSVGLALAWIFGCFLVFTRYGIWIYVAQPLMTIPSIFIFSAIYDHFLQYRERLKLFHIATRDGLTGAYVIRHFRYLLTEAIKECHITKQPLALILIDIDHFKQINDTYGHQGGDMIVRETVKRVNECIRPGTGKRRGDIVGRYGGDELIVMLRGANMSDAFFKIAVRILETVRASVYDWEGKKASVTLSMGVAILKPGDDIEVLIQRADAALYRSKEGGRNQVSLEQ